MATDLKDPSTDNDKIQKHYDDKFSDLTSPEHMAKDGKSGKLDLDEAEQQAVENAKAMVDGSENKYTPSDNTNSPKKSKSRFRNMSGRNKGILGGTSAVVIMLTIFLIPIITAPLQFIHISQLLIPDFDGVNAMSDSRGARLVKYLYHGDANIERTRLGVVGNRVADKVETKLASDGVRIIKNDAGYMVDIEVDGSRIGVSENGPDGKPTKNVEYRNKLRDVLKTKGYGKTATALMSRPMFYRYGVDFKPLGNVKRTANETLADFRKRVKDDIDSRVKNGTFDTSIRSLEESRTELETQRQEALANGDTVRAESLQAQIDAVADVGDGYTELFDGQREIADDFKNSDAPDDVKIKDASNSLVDKFSGKGSAIAAMVGLSVCFTRGIGEQIKFGEYVNRYLPQMRMALRAISVGQQIYTGQPVDADEVSIVAESFTNSDGESWAAGEQIQYKTTGELDGVPTTPTVLIGAADDSAWTKIGDFLDFPGVGPVCDLMGNVFFTSVLAVGEGILSIFSGGTVAVVKVAAQEVALEAFSRFLLSPVGEGVVRSVVGAEVPADAAGPLYGNIIAQGSHFAANESAREMGGFSLTSTQAVQLQDYVEDNNPERFAQKSFFDKYLNPKLPTSVIGAAAMKSYASNDSFLERMNPVNIAKMALSVVGSLFAPNANAADDDLPYSGVPKVAFTSEEIESDLAEDPFENANYLLDKYGSDAALEAEFGDCFPEVPSLVTADVESDYYLVNNLCPEGTQTFQDDFYRYRMYRLDYKLLLSLGCYSGDESSCSELGVN